MPYLAEPCQGMLYLAKPHPTESRPAPSYRAAEPSLAFAIPRPAVPH